jgi:hypothetical protein
MELFQEFTFLLNQFITQIIETESYAQNNTLDHLVSTETWYLFDARPPDLRTSDSFNIF